MVGRILLEKRNTDEIHRLAEEGLISPRISHTPMTAINTMRLLGRKVGKVVVP